MVVFLSQLIRGFRTMVTPRSSQCPNRPASASPAARPAPPRRGPAIQSLEGRTMYAASGLVTGERLIGPNDAITAVVLTVNQHLDPVTADNPLAYQIYHRVIQTTSSSDGIFGFGGSDGGTNIRRLGIPFSSAVYDDATMTVTLTPEKPFPGQKYFSFVFVHGNGVNGIRTAQGDFIAGNGKKAGHRRFAQVQAPPEQALHLHRRRRRPRHPQAHRPRLPAHFRAPPRVAGPDRHDQRRQSRPGRPDRHREEVPPRRRHR